MPWQGGNEVFTPITEVAVMEAALAYAGLLMAVQIRALARVGA